MTRRARADVASIALVALVAGAIIAAPARAQPMARTAALVSYGAAASSIEPDVRVAIDALATIALKDAKATAADVAAAAELGTSCDPTNIDCLASLAVLLRVDLLVVSSSAGADGADGSLELFVVDALRGKESARVPVDTSKGAQLHDSVELLLEPERHFGTLTVRAPPSSSITIDGALLNTPDTPTRVHKGKHRVVVELMGHEPFLATVDVAAAAESVVDAMMRPETRSGDAGTSTAEPYTAATPVTPPGISGAWVMAASGVGVAVAGGVIALGIDAGLGAGLGSAAEKEGYQAIGVVALVVASTGVAVAAVGAVIALLAAPDT